MLTKQKTIFGPAEKIFMCSSYDIGVRSGLAANQSAGQNPQVVRESFEASKRVRDGRSTNRQRSTLSIASESTEARRTPAQPTLFFFH